MFAFIKISEAETLEAVNSILPYLDKSLYSKDPILLDCTKAPGATKTRVEPGEYQKYIRDDLDPYKWHCLAKERGVVCGKVIKGVSSSNVLKHYNRHRNSESSKNNSHEEDKMARKREMNRVYASNYYRRKMQSRLAAIEAYASRARDAIQ